jgi:hypothetical protein
MRQRFLYLGFLHTVAAIAAGCALAGCTATGPTAKPTAPLPGTPRTASSLAGASPAASQTAASSAPSGPRLAVCAPGELAMRFNMRLSPATGENAGFLMLVNGGDQACTLSGYPRVRLYAGGRAMPFHYASGGGPYVTTSPPATVTLKPGGPVWFLLAKYRCDEGEVSVATTITVTWSGADAAPLSIPIAAGYVTGDLAYCAGGSADPGQTVTVSPFELAPVKAVRM